MSYELLNFKTHSGSRQFAELPETVFFEELREATKKLKGARETEFLTDWATEVWLDFEFCEHRFSINNQFGNYWFFVENPNCPDEILLKVFVHFHSLLEK